ncbi:Uncharacterized conserved protein YndB, AHSA1/START domain [Amycolatopsis marina]|uniref:Uncharacterized conserved protein YndB, AHSA1/START domain n=1 Tax=Amycolatopsis marina TaxID=490629 RepID=A0A1I1BLJ7_9PSEU|nr:SRPBCC family protein [Amycolatopsis marina]SFB50486.1 Uncharacterized conserved protein YndB, AHSA1/START domain [Amycolatopsis marina]
MNSPQPTGMDDAPDLRDRRGTLGVDGSGEWQIRFERHLSHAPERAWQALTDPAQQASWLPGVTIEPIVGGAVVFDFGEEGTATGEVRVVEAERCLEHTWLWPGEPESVVRWELSAEGTGTLLTLSHRPVRRDPAVDYSTGWHAMLDALHVHLDGGDPAELEVDFERLSELYRAGSEFR